MDSARGHNIINYKEETATGKIHPLGKIMGKG
jgi:hypothetical protein